METLKTKVECKNEDGTITLIVPSMLKVKPQEIKDQETKMLADIDKAERIIAKATIVSNLFKEVEELSMEYQVELNRIDNLQKDIEAIKSNYEEYLVIKKEIKEVLEIDLDNLTEDTLVEAEEVVEAEEDGKE